MPIIEFLKTNDSYEIADKQAREDINTIEKRFAIVKPSNDETGVQDVTNIQTALDTFKVVYLTDGNYYLNKPLIFGIGYELHGVSQIQTVINVLNNNSFIDGNPDGCDHISVTDMFISSTSPTKSNKCLNLYGNMAEPYNGARYSYFNNLWITGFDIAIAFSGVWSTVVNRVRCSNNNISVSCLGTCNNLSFIDCEFMQGVKAMTFSPSKGSELYGIRVVRCNFEGNSDLCIEASGVIALSIEEIYSESTPRLISINSCPNFSMVGGQVTGISLVGSIEATAYTSAKFKNPKYTIKDLNIECNITETIDLMYIGSGITGGIIEGIRLLNLGSGKVKLLPSISSLEYGIQETVVFNSEVTNIHTVINATRKLNDTVFITQVYFFVTQAFRPTSSGQLLCRVKKDGGDYETIGTLNLNAGQTYNVGQYLSFSITNNTPTKGQQEIVFVWSTSIGVSAYAEAHIVAQIGDLHEQLN